MNNIMADIVVGCGCTTKMLSIMDSSTKTPSTNLSEIANTNNLFFVSLFCFLTIWFDGSCKNMSSCQLLQEFSWGGMLY